MFRRPNPAWSAAEVEALIAEVSPELLAYLTRRTQPVDDAADVLAETLLTIWKRRADIPPTRDCARAWMFVTARNHLMNHARGQARRHALADRLRDNLAGYDEAAPSGDDRAELVRDALGALPPEDQELIGLIIWDGFGVAEAGAIMGLSASTSRSRYSRAKARFARALEGLQQP
ncbi:MAG: sigma-70 family RNA polymerase sigma factor [Protaetiibacter sp.]